MRFYKKSSCMIMFALLLFGSRFIAISGHMMVLRRFRILSADIAFLSVWTMIDYCAQWFASILALHSDAVLTLSASFVRDYCYSPDVLSLLSTF